MCFGPGPLEPFLQLLFTLALFLLLLKSKARLPLIYTVQAQGVGFTHGSNPVEQNDTPCKSAAGAGCIIIRCSVELKKETSPKSPIYAERHGL